MSYVDIGILLLGGSSVGKRSLKMMYGTEWQWDPTLEDEMEYQMKVIDKVETSMTIFTGGNLEFYISMTQMYVAQADAVMIVWARNDVESFQNVQSYLKLIRRTKEENLAVLIVENKCDLEETSSSEEGMRIAEEYGCGYICASAMENTNVADAFEWVCRRQRLMEFLKFHGEKKEKSWMSKLVGKIKG